MKPLSLILPVVLLAGFTAASKAEEPRSGGSGYIQYWPGDLPIVLSAPHGGKLAPQDLPNRTYGRLMRDSGTFELALELRKAMQERFGKTPHLIVCQLARVKLDCNRELKEAAQGHSVAEQAWHKYHDFILESEKSVLAQYPAGLYLDIHGHSHDKQRVELGYLLSKSEVQWPVPLLHKPEVAKRSSIRLLDKISREDFPALLRGTNSLGGLLEQRGIAAVPSPTSRMADEDLYFSGGYNTETHGSIDGKGLDGIQVETPQDIRETAEKRREFAQVFTEALEVYFQKHYRQSLSLSTPVLEAE
jgi:hypothetical protein